MIDIAVIGAGPAGYSAAITARKRDQSVVVIGQNTGWLARAEHVANYPGLPDISGRDLLSAMANQAQALGAELRPGVVHQVIATVEVLTCCLATVTYWLPGPKILSVFGMLSVP